MSSNWCKTQVRAEAIHGNKSQNARLKALAGFRSGRTKVLVATDIASRGIDVEGITHVINYDLPNEPECYIHRIGRTARAGASGIAISFCNAQEKTHLRSIQRLIKQSVAVHDPRSYGIVDNTQPLVTAKNRPSHRRRSSSRAAA